MKLKDMFPVGQVIPKMKSRTLRQGFKELLGLAGSVYTAIPPEERDDILELLIQREAMGSTCLGSGVAVPHVYHDRFRQLIGVVGRSVEGLGQESECTERIHAVFLLIVPWHRTDIHMLALSKVSKVVQEPSFITDFMDCSDEYAIHDLLAQLDEQSGPTRSAGERMP